MAGKKNPRSSKTDHVLNLLTDTASGPSSAEAEPASAAAAVLASASEAAAPPEAPAAPEAPEASEPSTPPTAAGRVPERHLAPPILEVARTNNEALEATIQSALEDALQEELVQAEEAEAPPSPLTGPEAAEPLPDLPAAGTASADVPAASPDLGDTPISDAPPDPAETPVPAEASEPQPEESPLPSDSGGETSSQSLPYYYALPDGARFVNVMPPLVEETLERYVRLFHLCDCPRCLADAKALALSRLPAKYVVLTEHAFTPMMSLYRAKFDSMVTTQVVYACKQIIDAPRHLVKP